MARMAFLRTSIPSIALERICYPSETVQAIEEELLNVRAPQYVAFDLDGTVALYEGWKGLTHIGEPIPVMLDFIKAHIDSGIPVVIMTARVASLDKNKVQIAKDTIDAYFTKHLGQTLPLTCIKDKHMVRLYDDRAREVILNTGRIMLR